MNQHEVSRTLVKSPPEIWAQCSDPQALGRHLKGPFGEIRITRLEPEQAVAWEGDRVSGTIRIDPSAWGTRVTLTAELEESERVQRPRRPEATAEILQPDGGPAAEEERAPAPLEDGGLAPEREALSSGTLRPAGWARRLWSRVRGLGSEDGSNPEPDNGTHAAAENEFPDANPAPGPDMDESGFDAEAALSAALESLGQAHHRPFSRA